MFSLQESSKLFKEFADNQMKSNTNKCHLIVSINDIAETQVGDSSIKSSSSENVLGVNTDSEFLIF